MEELTHKAAARSAEEAQAAKRKSEERKHAKDVRPVNEAVVEAMRLHPGGRKQKANQSFKRSQGKCTDDRCPRLRVWIKTRAAFILTG
jgi:hypothetical protein